MIFRSHGIFTLAIGALLGSAGCELAALEISTELAINFSVASDIGYFDSGEITYSLDDNPDIADNREKLEESVIKLKMVTVKLTKVDAQNTANFGWGKVYAYPTSTPLTEDEINADIKADCTVDSIATACFEAIPIGEKNGELNLDMTPAQKANLLDLMFKHPELGLKIVGWTDQLESPVIFDAVVKFSIEATTSIL